MASLAGEEYIQALMNKELKDKTRVRWKKKIAPKFYRILPGDALFGAILGH